MFFALKIHAESDTDYAEDQHQHAEGIYAITVQLVIEKVRYDASLNIETPASNPAQSKNPPPRRGWVVVPLIMGTQLATS